MKILPIIAHLRATMPDYFSRIDAVATYELALDRKRIEIDGSGKTLPAFFLMLGGDNITKIVNQPEIRVEFDELLSVIAVLENKDETGKYAQDQVHDVRKILMACLLNYQSSDDSMSFVYAPNRILAIDDARYVHEFQFKQLSCFDKDDGYKPSLDYFDSLYVDWNLTHASKETQPNARDEIKKIYPLNP
jgi:hypothetical protein